MAKDPKEEKKVLNEADKGKGKAKETKEDGKGKKTDKKQPEELVKRKRKEKKPFSGSLFRSFLMARSFISTPSPPPCEGS